MKTKISNSVLCLILVVFAASLGTAQDKSKSDTRTITGCLSKGDNAKEFQLAGNDGSSLKELAEGGAAILSKEGGAPVTAMPAHRVSALSNSARPLEPSGIPKLLCAV